MRKAFLIPVLILLVGCGSSLKHSWINFRAYYNIYYNAKEYYRAGLEKEQNQPEEIDPGEPIRVHRPPFGSGDQDFQNAIDKGAKILRKFPDSKWIDETLELIGKSYYYRQEYYSALQKFEEQYRAAQNPDMRQRAVIWKGRVLLDLEQYNQGPVFLEDELSKLSGEWEPEYKAKVQVLLAEHYVQQQEWKQAAGLLTSALPQLSKGPMKARTQFLHGQVLEIEGSYKKAAQAYGRVQSNRPGFELLYWGNYKQAEVLRKMGNLEQATAIYERMRKDDKNVDRLPEIYYELARTEEAKGNVSEALRIYKEVLRNRTYQVSQNTRADIYYRLGQIYTDHLNKYQLAAAYYDSSSSLRNRTERTGMFEENLNTETLARAYGQYSKLQNRIARFDSLLWLGSLPQAQFDSVIAEIKEQRLQQLEEQKKNQQYNSSALTNVNGQQTTGTGDEQRSSSAYGFLDYRNSRRLAEARAQFRAVWGNRALVDNWRRIEAVRNSSGSQQQDSGEVAGIGAATGRQGEQLAQLQIDLSEVPFMQKEKQEMRNQRASSWYELGNLFMLTLQQPDSAAHYFKKVIEQHPEHDLVPRALYSLYELYTSQGEPEQARKWADRLVQNYPGSRYTRQLQKQLGEESGAALQDTTASGLKETAGGILTSGAPTDQIAKELRNLALANKNESAAASAIHYEAIRQYIKLAQEHDMLENRNSIVEALLADSVYTGGEPETPYQGAYWDSVRTVLSEHQANFSGTTSAKKVDKLSEELEKASVSEEESGEDAESSMPTCQELGIKPEVRQGMQAFLENVEWPDRLEDVNLSGSVEYDFVITASGEIEDHTLVSKRTNLGIEEAFEKAIEEHLAFAPLELENNTPEVRCRVSFPISQ